MTSTRMAEMGTRTESSILSSGGGPLESSEVGTLVRTEDVAIVGSGGGPLEGSELVSTEDVAIVGSEDGTTVGRAGNWGWKVMLKCGL